MSQTFEGWPFPQRAVVPAQLVPHVAAACTDSCWPLKTGPREACLEQMALMIYWMWQRKDTQYELGDNLWQETLSVSLILSDKNIVTSRHLGNKQAGAFQVT